MDIQTPLSNLSSGEPISIKDQWQRFIKLTIQWIWWSYDLIEGHTRKSHTWLALASWERLWNNTLLFLTGGSFTRLLIPWDFTWGSHEAATRASDNLSIGHYHPVAMFGGGASNLYDEVVGESSYVWVVEYHFYPNIQRKPPMRI